MKVGIDISQIAFEGTGVGRYVQELVAAIVNNDEDNEYILFASSLRQRKKFFLFYEEAIHNKNRVKLKVFWYPPTILDLLWNQLHIFSIESFIGPVDVFWSSDWTQPPLSHAKGITTIHDVSFLYYPESFSRTILSVQKRRLMRAKQECEAYLCDSKATCEDAKKLLGIKEEKLHVVYPGFSI